MSLHGHDPLAEEAVEAIIAIAGRHDGFRVAHAKGTFATGTFTPTAEAAALSRAQHLGAPVEVVARVSNGSGNPHESDAHLLDGRGLAVKFFLPDGTDTDIVALTVPQFFVRTPEDFVAFTTARRPDPETGVPDMEQFGAFLAAHPETAAALGPVVGSLGAPVSYATCAYNSIHSFRLEPSGTWVRWRWEPAAGEAKHGDDTIPSLGPDYLQEDLAERLAGDGTITWTLHAVLAQDGDPLDDATVAWPAERERVAMGVLELGTVDPDREHGDHIEVFDPLRVTDGVVPSDDPILHFRRRAYDVSATRRWAGAATD